MIFLGYEQGTKGYRFLWNNRSIYVETTATFVENYEVRFVQKLFTLNKHLFTPKTSLNDLCRM